MTYIVAFVYDRLKNLQLMLSIKEYCNAIKKR